MTRTLLFIIILFFSQFALADGYITVQILCPNGKPIAEGYNTDTQMDRDIYIYLSANPQDKRHSRVSMPSGTVQIPSEWVGRYVIAETEGTEWDNYCADAFPHNRTEWQTRPFILHREGNRPVVMSVEKIQR